MAGTMGCFGSHPMEVRIYSKDVSSFLGRKVLLEIVYSIYYRKMIAIPKYTLTEGQNYLYQLTMNKHLKRTDPF